MYLVVWAMEGNRADKRKIINVDRFIRTVRFFESLIQPKILIKYGEESGRLPDVL